jgi:hypothetical protein
VTGFIPGGSAVSGAINTLAKVGITSKPSADIKLGGITTLAPSVQANASALAQQSSVGNALYQGSTGQPPTSAPVYGQAFSSAVADNKGIKEVELDENGNPKKPSYTMYYAIGLAVVYFLFIK